MSPDDYESKFLRVSETQEDRRRVIVSGVISVAVITLILLAIAYPDVRQFLGWLLEAYLDD